MDEECIFLIWFITFILGSLVPDSTGLNQTSMIKVIAVVAVLGIRAVKSLHVETMHFEWLSEGLHVSVCLDDCVKEFWHKSLTFPAPVSVS